MKREGEESRRKGGEAEGRMEKREEERRREEEKKRGWRKDGINKWRVNLKEGKGCRKRYLFCYCFLIKCWSASCLQIIF